MPLLFIKGEDPRSASYKNLQFLINIGISYLYHLHFILFCGGKVIPLYIRRFLYACAHRTSLVRDLGGDLPIFILFKYVNMLAPANRGAIKRREYQFK